MTEMTLCGYEVISLANKVIDYNQRYSSTGDNDDEYSPITLVVSSGDCGWESLGYGSISVYIATDADSDPIANYTVSGDLKLFTWPSYSVNGNTRGELTDIFSITDYVRTEYGSEDAAVNIAKSLSSIVLSKDQLDYNASSSTKNNMDYATSYATALGDYNSLTEGYKYWYGDEKSGYEIYETVYLAYAAMIDALFGENADECILEYYEYYQFKKAIFECTNIEYDDTYGRVSLIEFKFTGDIE